MAKGRKRSLAGKVPSENYDRIIAALKRLGFSVIRQRGKPHPNRVCVCVEAQCNLFWMGILRLAGISRPSSPRVRACGKVLERLLQVIISYDVKIKKCNFSITLDFWRS